MNADTRIPPEGEPLSFVRTVRTGRVHIRSWDDMAVRADGTDFLDYADADPAQYLADVVFHRTRMLCPVTLRVGPSEDWPAVPTGGYAFADDDLCFGCVRALGDQQWRAFHVDSRGEPAPAYPFYYVFPASR